MRGMTYEKLENENKVNPGIWNSHADNPDQCFRSEERRVGKEC